MFITQVIIPVLIIAGVCFWAGARWERERRTAELKKPAISEVGKYYGRRL